MLRRLGVDAQEVRLPKHLEGLSGIILPGGESTTIGKLAREYGLLGALRDAAHRMPIWGTCGGLVFMARDVGHEQPLLGIMNITVERNAFGRQVDSFEEDLDIKGVEDGPYHGIFIRAPEIKDAGPEVEVLCRLKDGRMVAARQDRLLVTSFHPELTTDTRVHGYFLRMVTEAQENGFQEPCRCVG